MRAVSASFDGADVHFCFGIPRGNDGTPGAQGETGPAGAPFTNFVVGDTTTLNPGQSAWVQATFNGTFVFITFGIPLGDDGIPGPQGPPGDVTTEQLTEAIAGTAANTNAVTTLDIPISDPPTQSEVEQVLGKVNELIVALRRPVL